MDLIKFAIIFGSKGLAGMGGTDLVNSSLAGGSNSSKGSGRGVASAGFMVVMREGTGLSLRLDEVTVFVLTEIRSVTGCPG